MRRRREQDARPTTSSRPSGSPERGSVSTEETADAIRLLEDGAFDDQDVAELEEFMTCERRSRCADPAFRERLRLELWWSLVVAQSGGRDRIPRA